MLVTDRLPGPDYRERLLSLHPSLNVIELDAARPGNGG